MSTPVGAPIPWNGSKRWLAQDLKAIFREFPPTTRFFDPFCGSASASHLFVMTHPESVCVLGDANPWLAGYMECLRTGGTEAPFVGLEYVNHLRSIPDAHLDRLPPQVVAIRFAACLLTSWGNRWLSRPDGTVYGPLIDEVSNHEWVQPRLRTFLTPRPWMSHIERVHHGNWLETVAGAKRGDVVYLDPPYPETLGYGNQPWGLEHLLDLVDWVHDQVRNPEGPHVVVSNMGAVQRLFARMGMNTRLVALRSGNKTRRQREEVLAWTGTTPTSVLDL